MIAVIEVFRNDAPRVQKRTLGELESDSVLRSIDPVFGGVPLKIGHRLHPRYMGKIPYFCMA
jgi:hypothetical protein